MAVPEPWRNAMVDALTPGIEESQVSAVSWAAILAGGVASAALTLLMLAFGTGMGFSVVSPWTNSGVSSTTFSLWAGLYLIVVAMTASSIGGYLAGRLRTKWSGVHTHEVYFRDTAHGFLAWAFATLLSADPSANRTAPDPAASRSELARLLTSSLRDGGDLSAVDRTYVAQVVASRTGLSMADAEKRVSDVVTQEKIAADNARKAAAHLALWLTVPLLIGAFSASLAATEGGGLRDGTWNSGFRHG